MSKLDILAETFLDDIYRRDDGNIELDVNDTDIKVLRDIYDDTELNSLLQFNIDMENYEGADMIMKVMSYLSVNE